MKESFALKAPQRAKFLLGPSDPDSRTGSESDDSTGWWGLRRGDTCFGGKTKHVPRGH